MNFRVRWQDIVKRIGDTAIKDDCSIRKISESQYSICIGSQTLKSNTAEGVEMLLEEYGIEDEKWQ